MKIKDFNYKNNSFHEIVANRIDKMIKLYEKNEDFHDIMPFINKHKTTAENNKKLVYTKMKFHTPFMKTSVNNVKKIEARKNNIKLTKNKINELYKQSDYDLKKLKMKTIERFKKLKELDLKNDSSILHKYLIRNSSDFNENMKAKTSKINKNFSFNDSYSLNNSNNNFSMSNIFTKNTNNSKEKSTYNKSDTNFRNISFKSLKINTPKINEAKYIIYRCGEEMDSCKEVNESMNKMDEALSKTIKNSYKSIKLSSETGLFNLDNIAFKKYKIMETNNLKEIKRKMNEKISDFYAFRNRKGFNDLIKNSGSTNAYYIYMHDMDKTNARLEERRNKAKKIIDKVELLCEDEVNKKEYLKNLIDIYNKKHSKIKNLQKINIKKSELNMMQNNKIESESDDENLNIYNPQLGNFFPKLLTLREQNIEQINVGNFLFKKKKNNTKQNTHK